VTGSPSWGPSVFLLPHFMAQYIKKSKWEKVGNDWERREGLVCLIALASGRQRRFLPALSPLPALLIAAVPRRGRTAPASGLVPGFHRFWFIMGVFMRPKHSRRPPIREEIKSLEVLLILFQPLTAQNLCTPVFLLATVWLW